ncbi:hypothetical protein [Lysobacter antibioticus]|uniref:Phage late control D family protein n=1 Tax=Lysobacter antibioticus TaxID=84531 RepID=A0A0S2FBN6_LYSAN|nr:hypothetical protein [Lysobacter antibioticus]ALN80953.1 hypothetical protein LA76x_2823 [Lysobacter antibioticus]
MVQGIHLTLMIGPAVPVPAPRMVVDALQSVEVTSGKDKSGFQLSFGVSKDSPLLTTLLPAGYFDPIATRVVVMVTLGGFPHVLMDGLVTRQELAPSSDPGQSVLTITGDDLSTAMDLVELALPYPNMSSTVQAYQILARYAGLGIVPIVIPPFIPEQPIMTKKIEAQNGTDLEHLKKIADDSGFVFYVEPGPLPGQSIAYLGPNIRIPVPQPALSINMDAHTNVESMSFQLDGLAKETLLVNVHDPITGRLPLVIPIPSVNIFQPPLGARPTPPLKTVMSHDTGGDSTEFTLKKMLGRMLKGAANAITVSGSLDVLRYGHVLRSKLMVGVRGAGLAYDGLYYVDSVTHKIKRGEFKQSFELSRDGLISLTPRVPT